MAKKIAIVVPSLEGGGAERAALNLVKGLHETDVEVELVAFNLHGAYVDMLPDGVRCVDLKKKQVFTGLWALSRYIKHDKPDAIISFLNHVSVVSILASWISRNHVPVYPSVQGNISHQWDVHGLKERFIIMLSRWLFPYAKTVVAVSKGIESDVQNRLNINNTSTIFNPIVTKTLFEIKDELISHPWIKEASIPTILAVGRFVEEKDYPTLLKALAKLRQQRPARLIILGEGALRSELEAEIIKLGLEDAVDLHGFVNNPYAYMAKADIFVLSSKSEGLPSVLIEALACGVPVVSTDCPSGPHEILDNGKFGPLVPVGDYEALAIAIQQTLESPIEKKQRTERAKLFEVNYVVDQYLQLLGFTS